MGKEKLKQHARSEVIRDAFIIQLKLIIDGLRDLMLMPLVLVATIGGLILHNNQPGRYLYRLLRYGKASEKWIGLFDEANKDVLKPLNIKENSLDQLVKKTQTAFESKYINEDKKQKLLDKLNFALDEINTKFNPEKKA